MDLSNYKEEFDAKIAKLELIENLAQLNDEVNKLKIEYTSKKGILASLFSLMGKAIPEEKSTLGKEINDLKVYVNSKLDTLNSTLEQKQLEELISKEKVDITLPRRQIEKGSIHPLQLTINEITTFFRTMGYNVSEGPEVESDYYNFELLNTPSDHPARDMQDSFFIDASHILRSHTSAIQAHVMENSSKAEDIKIICPGKVYRRDSDATHSHEFFQVEGLVIGKKVNMGTLMETLTIFLKSFFGKSLDVRFRPSYFPFTEPSVEVDVSCFQCKGKGCSLCKHSGWIEVLGAGMVHPNVLRLNGFNDKVYQGFAFGIGIDRLTMLKYGVDDIKKFYNNDVDFLKQFAKETK